MGSNPQPVGFTVTLRAAAPRLASLIKYLFRNDIRSHLTKLFTYDVSLFYIQNTFNGTIFLSIHSRCVFALELSLIIRTIVPCVALYYKRWMDRIIITYVWTVGRIEDKKKNVYWYDNTATCCRHNGILSWSLLLSCFF